MSVDVRSRRVKIEGESLNTILKLFDETTQFSYDESGNISTISKTLVDAEGNPRTITFTLEYDESGNIKKIDKKVS